MTWKPRLHSKAVGLILLLLALLEGLHLLWPRTGDLEPDKSAWRYSMPSWSWTGTSETKDVFSRFAQCQYVTHRDYLCNPLTIFELLSQDGSRADFLLTYPQHWNIDASLVKAHLLRKARRDYKVKLAPIEG
jgi:hypothetical protein